MVWRIDRAYIIAALLVIVSLFEFFMVNCAGQVGEPFKMSSEGAQGGAAGKAAFQSSVYAFARTTQCTSCVKTCATCHGSTQTPLFAVSDVSAAYAAALTKVPSFTNVDSSKFITKAGDGHCGTECSNLGSAMRAKLVEWAAGELGGGGSGVGTVKYTTATLQMPNSIPASPGNPAVMRFPFSSVTTSGGASVPASLSGALIEVELQMSSGGMNYRVSRVKVAGNTAAVAFSHIHVYIRAATEAGIGGEYNASVSPWVALSGISAPVFSLPNPLPTGPLGATPLSADALLIPKTSAASAAPDFMTIGIEQIQ